MKDVLGQISLNRAKRSRSIKKRKTQSKEFYRFASGASIKAQMNSFGNFKISSGDIKISNDDENPKNVIVTQTNMPTFGTSKTQSFSSFDDIKKDPQKSVDVRQKNRNNIFVEDNSINRNGVFDVTRRNPFITKTNTKEKENSIIKCSVGANISNIDKVSTVISGIYEFIDSGDGFKEDNGSEHKDVFYTSEKNYYNSGKINPFSEKENVKNNTIIQEIDSNNPYYGSHKRFASFGFIYKGNKPDSISFGGLKR